MQNCYCFYHDQASGGKPKEQSATKKEGSAVIYQVGTDNIITEATQTFT
jgi:hypothetical protein